MIFINNLFKFNYKKMHIEINRDCLILNYNDDVFTANIKYVDIIKFLKFIISFMDKKCLT